MKKLRVIVLMHSSLVPPESVVGLSEEEIEPWKTEWDVVYALEESLGHVVMKLGLLDELLPLRNAIEGFRPDVAFNLLEEFDGRAIYDANVVAYLELMKTPYTGCNPRGLIVARDKALSKKILAYHRIRAPEFHVFLRGRKIERPRRLPFPLFVKALNEEASLGIAQASVVDSDEKLAERVRFVHESVGTDAIAERYIAGRELYVGVLGNDRLQAMPVWELKFTQLAEGLHPIATRRVKWNRKYQDRHGIESGPAEGLDPAVEKRIVHLSKRIYRYLGLDGYARMDFRLSPDNEVYFIEANPNPQIAEDEDLAVSAEAAGLDYPALIQKVLGLGFTRGG